MIKYYDLKDVKKIGQIRRGKDAKNVTWPDLIYENGEWVPDDDMLIADRLLGVDSSEPSGSPYRFGNSDMLNMIEEIDEKQVPGLILKYY